jgi:arabinogalactan endo-1,4-beta-galactosidase
VLLGTAAGAGALALGAGTMTEASAASSFIKGADISWLPQMEANGYTFNNSSGTRQDLLTILKGYGINAARMRTFVNPSSDRTNGHCSIDETAALALRCKNAGLQVMIDFMFGDTWNSVGHQTPPAAWASMTYAQMLSAIQNYVFHCMNVLKYNGVTPTWVQIGNEINAGICLPVGSLAHQPAQLTGLLNGAYNQVKAVFPSTSVLIHLAQPQNYSVITNFLDSHRSRGGKWDITAFSSYGAASAAPGICGNMKAARDRYGKPVIQTEFGGRVDRATQTRDAMAAYISGLKSFGGLGLFYWEPEGYSPFTSYNMGAWDSATRRPTVALDPFKTA